MPIKLIITILGVIYSSALYAQSTRVLQNLPPSVKWYQINTPHFRIIYPHSFSAQGQRMANTMEHVYAPVAKSMESNPRKKLPLILQNHSAVSNGFVTLGPRRSEFFTMSPQRANFLGNNDWLNMLALHEFRHVVQYEKSRTGLTGFLRILFGEYTQAAIANATVPSWFWEGDAVGVETALSASGRGRIPEFSAAFRANLLEKGAFNYNKQYLRSFKDFIPNHYVLGYHYATYLKNEYGEAAVAQMVNRTWALPFIPFSFSFAQKKYGGKKMPQMYQEMMGKLKSAWLAQQAALKITDFKKVNTNPKKVYTNYDYPQLLDNGKILVLKSGLGDYEQFVELDPDSGTEEVKFVPGTRNDAGLLSVQGSTVVWNEFTYDPRWRQRTYSVIRTYNLATDTYHELTKGSRYSSASLSPDRSKIVTIEEVIDYTQNLTIIDAYSGKVIKKYSTPEGRSYFNPTWTDDKNIVYAEVQSGYKKIKEINIETGKEQLLLGPTQEQISYAFKKGQYLYYVSGGSGIDNIYAKDLHADKVFQITSSKYGAYNPAITADDKVMYYNNLTELGNDVVKINLHPEEWQQVTDISNTDIKFYQPMVEMEDNVDILNSIPEKHYEEKRYHKKLLKLHSWGPFIADSPNELEAGLYSTNVLSTTDAFAGFRVDLDNNFKWIGRVSYQSFYPIIDVEASYAFRNATTNYKDTTDAILTDKRSWKETGVKAGFRFPWYLTRNKFYTNLILQNYIGLTSIKDYQSSAFGSGRQYFTQLNDGNLRSNEFKITFSSLYKRSKRDIKSKFGSVFIIENFGTPFGGDFKGGLTAIKSQLYFPGLFKHHSLNFFVGYQHNNITLDNNNYWFPNRMPYPRGVRGSTFEDFYTIRSNYDLPLLYPDLSIGPWLYFQRIKAEMFFDFGSGKASVTNQDVNLGYNISKNYYSTGVELTFDFNLMRALPLLELGVRYSYVPENAQAKFEFLVGSFGF